MIPHQQHPTFETDEDISLLSRRTLLRRSMAGLAGVGLAPLLAACGGDEGGLEVDDVGGEVQAPEEDATEPALQGDIDTVDQADSAVDAPDTPEVDPEEPAIPGPEGGDNLDD